MIRGICGELRFLLELWKVNLFSAMEYRASFISQVIGMIINDIIYFLFWFLFFDRFRQVEGWAMKDMILLFSIITVGFGLGNTLFGNSMRVAELISDGRLDYYLALPRNVLLHVLASRSMISAIGDLFVGIIAFACLGKWEISNILIWLLSSICSGIIMVCSMAIFGCLSFWLGNASQLSSTAHNALLTLSLYPENIFQGGIRFLMFTILPAGLIGAIPYRIVRDMDWIALCSLMIISMVFIILLWMVFSAGLKRYESGSAIAVNL